jgi:uncharacterized protein (DUF697 family)
MDDGREKPDHDDPLRKDNRPRSLGYAHGQAIARWKNKIFGGTWGTKPRESDSGRGKSESTEAVPAQNADDLVSKVRQRIKREFFDIEDRTDLSDDEKVSQLRHITCATCAGIAIQPIPFADIFILTPVQALAGSRIAAVRGVPVSESEVSDVIKEIAGVVGLGLIAQQLAIGAWKIVLPGGGAIFTIPLVYGLTYAICSVMDKYFVAKSKGRKLSADEIRDAWKKSRKAGEQRSKSSEAEIREKGPGAR